VGDQRESLIGERVRVWWEGDEEWFHGRVVEWNCLKQDGRGMHQVKYDDGDCKWEFLDGDCKWEREMARVARMATAAAKEEAAAEEEAEEAAAEEEEEEGVELPAAPQRPPLAVIDLDGLVSQRARLSAPAQRVKPSASSMQDPGRMRRKQQRSHQPRLPQQGRPVRIKHEDAENGTIRCPSCKSALQVGTQG
jgi:hypothetical protein